MQTKTRFPLEELVRLPDFLLPGVSPDGSKIAFYADYSGRIELWVLDLATGERRQVSHGEVPRAPHEGFTWNHAGTAIVFPHDEGGDEQHDLWSLDLVHGEVSHLTDTPQVQEIPIEFSPDDEWISFVSTRDGQLNLYTMRRDGSDVQQLTRFENPVLNGGIWSPDGSRLVVAANETADPHNSDVYVVSADGGEPRKVYSSGQGALDYPTDWSPDGRSIAITSDTSGADRAGVLDLESGTVRWFGAEGVEETSRTFSPDGRLLLVLRNHQAVVHPVIYDVETGAERVPALPAATTIANPVDADFALGGKALAVRYSGDTTRSTLMLYDLDSSETRALIEPTYGPIDPSVFVTAEDIHYPSFDGLRIHALLYRPHHAGHEERVPAVVMPHGGPTWQYFHRFDPFIQFLVNEGYAVLAPNIRGSTGYGVEFRDMARHDWGGADLRDVVAGRDYLASLHFVDGDRIAVFGGSYGGFMTFIAVTKAPEAWKAGVAWVGISDLRAMYEESMPHFKYFLREQMGDPEENADRWADRSAANFADRMTARLLIVHGVNDPRCPISQARLFRDRLLAAGKVEGRDFEYAELGEEGHGSVDQEQRLRTFRLLADFFERNL